MSRRITFLTLFLWLMTVTFPVIAQQKADSTYTFRFVPQKDMFYVPWNGNDTELARLLECIENSKATIFDGKLPLLVDGYCNSLGGEAENLATAKIRANRVKSELVIRAKIKEENFITRNHAAEGDFGTVRLTVPVKETSVTDAEAQVLREAEAARLETEKRAEQERLAEEERLAQEQRLAEEQHKAEEARLAAEKSEAGKSAQQNKLTDTPSETKITTDYHLSLRANLLRWATLTPDLGLEWRICPSWGIAVNGSWISWTWSDKDRRYALWEVAPEIRYYMGEKKAWYLDALPERNKHVLPVRLDIYVIVVLDDSKEHADQFVSGDFIVLDDTVLEVLEDGGDVVLGHMDVALDVRGKLLDFVCHDPEVELLAELEHERVETVVVRHPQDEVGVLLGSGRRRN